MAGLGGLGCHPHSFPALVESADLRIQPEVKMGDSNLIVQLYYADNLEMATHV